MNQQECRGHTEDYLLTLASRLENVDTVVVLVKERDGRYTSHLSNYESVPWAEVIGNLETVKYDIASTKISWSPVEIDGSELEE